MQHVTLDRLAIAFGGARTSFAPDAFKKVTSQEELLRQPRLQLHLHTLGGFSNLLLLDQTHSITGYAFASEQACKEYKPYAWQGDYLITSVPGVGIGVATADCLPIVMYDHEHQVIAIVHAGWRGSVEGVACAALQQMQSVFGTNPKRLAVFFGPAARACCYEVQEDVANELPEWALKDCLEFRNHRAYLNVPLLNELQLMRAGVQDGHVAWQSCDCTICTFGYCSWRRDNTHAQRQLTVAMLCPDEKAFKSFDTRDTI